MQRRRLITALALLGAANISFADNSINSLQNVGQANFKLLSEDLSSTLSYKGVIPATPLGITGFDLGIEASATKLQHPAVWQQATNSTSAPSTIYVPKIHVHKGLPLGFDVGAFYTSVPTSNIKLFGAEVRYALVEGGITL